MAPRGSYIDATGKTAKLGIRITVARVNLTIAKVRSLFHSGSLCALRRAKPVTLDMKKIRKRDAKPPKKKAGPHLSKGTVIVTGASKGIGAVSHKSKHLSSAESRLESLGIQLPSAPTPFGSYVEVVESGRLLFLSGMLPVIDHKPAYVGKIGKDLDSQTGRDAARVTAIAALSAARDYLGTLDRIKRVVRLGVFMVTADEFTGHPAVADGASDLLRDIFGKEKMAVRLVIGVANLPLGVPIELEVIFELEE
jgi:enamine deaminase RidA (YjgF/YER057c/UK114 family)